MEYKINAYYIVTKGDDKKDVFTGDTLVIRLEPKRFHTSLGMFTIFLPDKSIPEVNKCIYFKSKEELDTFMQGIELKYNEKLVNEILIRKQKEIDNIKMLHEIPALFDFVIPRHIVTEKKEEKIPKKQVEKLPSKGKWK